MTLKRQGVAYAMKNCKNVIIIIFYDFRIQYFQKFFNNSMFIKKRPANLANLKANINTISNSNFCINSIYSLFRYYFFLFKIVWLGGQYFRI